MVACRNIVELFLLLEKESLETSLKAGTCQLCQQARDAHGVIYHRFSWYGATTKTLWQITPDVRNTQEYFNCMKQYRQVRRALRQPA